MFASLEDSGLGSCLKTDNELQGEFKVFDKALSVNSLLPSLQNKALNNMRKRSTVVCDIFFNDTAYANETET